MKTTTRPLFLAFAVLIFAFLPSCAPKIERFRFIYTNPVEDPKVSRSYLLMNYGDKIYGREIEWNSGIMVKDVIRIDEKKFKTRQVIGYMDKGVFYGRVKNKFLKRIVHGKINVYGDLKSFYTPIADPNGQVIDHVESKLARYFAQTGDLGPLVALRSQSQIEKLVQGCPEAMQLAHKSNRELHDSLSSNPSYLNHIFELFNNGCKLLPDMVKSR